MNSICHSQNSNALHVISSLCSIIWIFIFRLTRSRDTASRFCQTNHGKQIENTVSAEYCSKFSVRMSKSKVTRLAEIQNGSHYLTLMLRISSYLFFKAYTSDYELKIYMKRTNESRTVSRLRKFCAAASFWGMERHVTCFATWRSTWHVTSIILVNWFILCIFIWIL